MPVTKSKNLTQEKKLKVLTSTELTHIAGGTSEKIELAVEKVERAK